MYYYATQDNGADSKRLQMLAKDALIFARNADFDVFNALNLMNNQEFISELKFLPGDGNLHYYFYNYRMKSIQSSDNGLVLL